MAENPSWWRGTSAEARAAAVALLVNGVWDGAKPVWVRAMNWPDWVVHGLTAGIIVFFAVRGMRKRTERAERDADEARVNATRAERDADEARVNAARYIAEHEGALRRQFASPQDPGAFVRVGQWDQGAWREGYAGVEIVIKNYMIGRPVTLTDVRLFALYRRNGGVLESCDTPWEIHGSLPGRLDPGVAHRIQVSHPMTNAPDDMVAVVLRPSAQVHYVGAPPGTPAGRLGQGNDISVTVCRPGRGPAVP